MHPFQSEMMTAVVLAERRRDAVPRRAGSHRWRRRAGARLVDLGDRLRGAGQRLQHVGDGELPCPGLRTS